jgi:hypothetical protein
VPLIEGNFIGTNVGGTAALGNGTGVSVDGAPFGSSACTIGGTAPPARNIISGNVGSGIISFFAAVFMQGNYIGTDIGGTVAIGNGNSGVRYAETGIFIGGTMAGARNIISGNGSGISADFELGLIQGNYIGTDVTGAVAIGNSGEGVFLFDPSGGTLGGTSPTARNIISGNGTGIMIEGGGVSLIQGNYIGVNAGGNSIIPNTGDGIEGFTDEGGEFNHVIGGAVPGAANVISGNGGNGINTTGIPPNILGNFIGTDASRTADLGNSSNGILFSNDIQFAQVRNNVVSFNDNSGVRIPFTDFGGENLFNVISSNSVFSNEVLGVDLGDSGVTRNDRNDTDVGPNMLQNFPIITSVTSMGGVTRIVGSFSGMPNTDYFIQFFSSPACQGSNPGQDQQVITMPILFHTGPDKGRPSGVAPIDLTLPNTMLTGFVNALASDTTGNTSEFSPCAAVNGQPCTYSISPTTQPFAANGGAQTITVTAGAGCNWTAESNTPFITITGGIDGTGNGMVSYTVAANLNSGSRTGTLTVAGQEFTVTQAGGSPCSFVLSPASQNFTAGGGSDSFTVTAPGGCNWAASSDVGWITTISTGTGSGQVRFTVMSNSGAQRTGSIFVEGQMFTVMQDAGASDCSFSLSPVSDSFPASGGSRSFTLTTGSACNWTAGSDVPWIAVTSFGTGGGSIFYTVAANDGPARTGVIYLAGQTLTIMQEGAGCSYSLSAPHQSFAANGGMGGFQIICGNNCSWVATENLGWVQITGVGAGSGPGTVNFTVSANTGSAPRNGTIIIADQSFTIFQGIQFNDVPVGHVFYTEIGKLSARGVTLGCNATSYCPDDVVTRQQMAAFIIRALGDFNPPQPPSQRFLDVLPSNPFYAFIEQMAIRQITLGCGGGNYCPGDPVLRDQMAAFIIRGLGEFNPPDPPFQRFPDVPPGNPFYRFIDRMAVLQITLGCGGGNYCPTLAVSRGQMAAFLVRAFNL